MNTLDSFLLQTIPPLLALSVGLAWAARTAQIAVWWRILLALGLILAAFILPSKVNLLLGDPKIINQSDLPNKFQLLAAWSDDDESVDGWIRPGEQGHPKAIHFTMNKEMKKEMQDAMRRLKAGEHVVFERQAQAPENGDAASTEQAQGSGQSGDGTQIGIAPSEFKVRHTPTLPQKDHE